MVELILLCAEDQVEPIGEILEDAGARALTVEDAQSETEAEQALFGEPGLPAPAAGWQQSRLCALFDHSAAAEAAAARLRAAGLPLELHTLREVPEADWVRVTQAQFAPQEIAPGFWIVPSWHEPPTDARRVMRLDPGLAFGTGSHPTTRMCLRWIAAHARAWPRVLDFGCGSGVLAIAAGLHGAHGIDAVDLDPAAISATRTNAAANGVVVQAGPPETAQGPYPLVIANILATPLKLLAPLLAAHVEAGGELLLAGILERQEDELRAAYAPWLALSVTDCEDGWILMHARRPA